MGTAQLKEEIGQYIQHADERFLQLVHGMIKADRNTKVGYQPDGTPITKQDLIARAQASEEDIKYGRVKSLKALKEEVKHW
ncbi:MAG: hypothetical protein RLQ12_18990 [Cyclobacteriaceae bacterium]